jgi:hypothetical protein
MTSIGMHHNIIYTQREHQQITFFKSILPDFWFYSHVEESQGSFGCFVNNSEQVDGGTKLRYTF